MRYRCRICGPLPMGLEFTSPNGECPKCGRSHVKNPYEVHELVDVHFIVLHVSGPILGSWGRQYVACQPKRDCLAGHPGDNFAATDDPRAVTCPACKQGKEWQEMAKLFPELRGGVPSGGIEITGKCC